MRNLLLIVCVLVPAFAFAQDQGAKPIYYFNPDWSPVGSRLVFESTRAGKFAIYTIRVDGSDLRKLTSGEFDDENPSWSRNGRQIVFKSDRDGHSQLYIMNRDGSKQRRLTQATDIDYAPSFSPKGDLIVRMIADGSVVRDPKVSPNGKHFAYAKQVSGRWGVYLYDLLTRKERLLVGAEVREPGIKDSAKNDLLPLFKAFISSLDRSTRSRTLFSYDALGRLKWARSPESREGLAVREMSASQRELIDKMLKSVLSEQGFRRAKAIMSDQDVLAKTEEGMGAGYYWLAIYGEPGNSRAWVWRLGGHHLSLHFTYVDNKLSSCSPAFFGAEETLPPNDSKEVGYKLLLPRRDLAHLLVASLDQKQSGRAVIAPRFSENLVISEARELVLTRPVGLPASEFDESQKATFLKLVEDYADVFSSAVARAQLEKVKQTSLTKIYFAWAGSNGPDAQGYYRVQGPDFLIEYSNSGRHIHSVWRELNDFGVRSAKD